MNKHTASGNFPTTKIEKKLNLSFSKLTFKTENTIIHLSFFGNIIPMNEKRGSKWEQQA